MSSFRLDEDGALVNVAPVRGNVSQVLFARCRQGGAWDTGTITLDNKSPTPRMVRISLLCDFGTFNGAFGNVSSSADGIEYDDGNHLGSWSYNTNGWNYSRLGNGPLEMVIEATSGGGGYWAGRMYGSTSENQQVDSRFQWQGDNGKVQFQYVGSDWSAVVVEALA